MKIAFLCSNVVSINPHTKKGTEIFVNNLVRGLHKKAKNKHLDLTVFAAGNSKLPVKIESVNRLSSKEDKDIRYENHKIFELALLSKAFRKSKAYDLYHANISCGEVVLPFLPFVRKPVVVTLHGFFEISYAEKYFPLFEDLPNLYFVAASESQKKKFPHLNFAATIHHGINVRNKFKFDKEGGEYLMWAGRAVPGKGMDIALDVIRKTGKKAKVFPLLYEEHLAWAKRIINKQMSHIDIGISMQFDTDRNDLVRNYQKSKLFLFPTELEEAFGLVMAESMACGTPVVAFDRGAVPEVVEDGKTGFIISSDPKNVRNDLIIKKTGIDGLIEAVSRIYSLPRNEYLTMRRACRERAVKLFSRERMIDDYIQVYRTVLKNWKQKNAIVKKTPAST